MPADLPTLAQLFEEQVERVLERLRRRAFMGFQAELDELLRFHRFLLATGSTEDEALAGSNLVEVSGVAWFTPHDEWMGQYRRIFDGAVELIGVDEHFLVALAQVLPTLLDEEDGVELTPGVVDGVLRLGPMLMHSVEEWVSRRTAAAADAAARDAGSKPTLGGADRRALESALPRVVGAWEEALAGVRHLLRHRPGPPPDARWEELRRAWRTMGGHLKRTAYCLAVATWHGDEVGARLFAGALSRWPRHALSSLSVTAEIRFSRLLMPDLLELSWADVLEAVEPLRLPLAPPPDPEGLFARLVQGARLDMELMTAAVLAAWTADGHAVSPLVPRIARALLHREQLDGDTGAPSRQRVLAQTTYDLLRLHAAGERHRPGAYGSWLDDALRSIETVTEIAAPPNRARPHHTLHGRAGLAPIEAAILATAPMTGGTPAVGLDDLARAGETIPGGDPLLRDAVRRLDGWIAALNQGDDNVRAGADLFGGWKAEQAAAVAGELRAGRDAVEQARLERLRKAPIASARVEALRQHAEEALRAGDLDLILFHVASLRFEDGVASVPPISIEIPWSKGNLTEPELADPVVGAPEVVRGSVSAAIAKLTMSEFGQRPLTTRTCAAWLSEPAFWRDVLTLAEQVGPAPSLLVDSRELGLFPFTAFSQGGALEAFQQTFDRELRQRLQAYGRTVGGVNVFSGRLGGGVAWLFSGDALRAISVRTREGDGPVEAAYRPDGPDGSAGHIDFRVALTTEWDTSPVFELRLARDSAVDDVPSDVTSDRRGAWGWLLSRLGL